jgi:hypothetical protein
MQCTEFRGVEVWGEGYGKEMWIRRYKDEGVKGRSRVRKCVIFTPTPFNLLLTQGISHHSILPCYSSNPW